MKILFVCTGNICRSPTAEGVLRHLVCSAGLESVVTIDSAGTHGYHVGGPPDPRTCAAAAGRGVDLSTLRARRVQADDFDRFDLILAMDRQHLAHLTALAPAGAHAEIKLFLDFHPTLRGQDVPDPYYGGGSGFRDVFDMIDETSRGLLAHVKTRCYGTAGDAVKPNG